MKGRPGRYLLLVGLVAGLLVLAPVGPVAGSSQSPPPESSPAGVSAAENQLNVTLTLSAAPENAGNVTIKMTVENPDDVEGLALEPTDRVTVQSTAGFEFRDGGYEWDGTTDRPTATYLYEVNRSTTGHLGTGMTSVDTGSWAILSPPNSPVSFNRGLTFILHGRTTVVESYELGSEGVLTGSVVYLGPHRTYATIEGSQTIRLVVPREAEMAVEPRRVLETLANASREIQIGGREEKVIGLVVPTTVQWATGGSATGPATFRVPADAPLRRATNKWIHEYTHTRDGVRADRSMSWLTEAMATYYGARVPLKQGLAGFSDVQSTLEKGQGHPDVRLADPGTWSSDANYWKGALVLGHLDRRIREETNGTHTLDDAIRRLNRHDGVVDAETFARTISNVSSPDVGAAARQYVTTTAVPETWSLSTHARHFGYEPGRFTYTFANPRAVGPTWNRSLDDASAINLLPSERLVVDGVIRNDGGSVAAFDVAFRTVPEYGSEPRRTGGWLLPGWNRTLTFSAQPDRIGKYVAVFGTGRNDHLSFQVVEAGRNATVSSITTTRSSVEPGATVTVTATVTNPDDRPAQTTIPITVDGRTVGNETVVLSGDESTEIATDVTLEAAGLREISFGTATVTVQIGPTATTTDDSATGDGSGPGFGPLLALLALAIVTLGRPRSIS